MNEKFRNFNSYTDVVKISHNKYEDIEINTQWKLYVHILYACDVFQQTAGSKYEARSGYARVQK